LLGEGGHTKKAARKHSPQGKAKKKKGTLRYEAKKRAKKNGEDEIDDVFKLRKKTRKSGDAQSAWARFRIVVVHATKTGGGKWVSSFWHLGGIRKSRGTGQMRAKGKAAKGVGGQESRPTLALPEGHLVTGGYRVDLE